MSAIGMMILYLKLENPETNLDRQSGMFNHSALMQYTRQFFGKEQGFAILAFVKKNSLHERRRSGQIGAFSMEMAEENAHCILQHLQSMEGRQCFYAKHCLVYMLDARVINGAEDILFLFHNIRQGINEYSKNNLILTDKARVEEMYREKETEKLLEYDIEKDRVEVYFQPVFSTKENRFTSAEALVRIRDEKGKIVPPGVFIEVAEHSGAILSLGKIIFEKVCRMIKERDIKQYGLHYLEITESASLDAKAVLLNNMEKLIACGVRFSLDDFGTGQSNLNFFLRGLRRKNSTRS